MNDTIVLRVDTTPAIKSLDALRARVQEDMAQVKTFNAEMDKLYKLRRYQRVPTIDWFILLAIAADIMVRAWPL